MLDDCVMGTVEGVVGERRTPLRRAWLRVGRRADGRAPLWIELAVIGWLFWLYDVINDFAPIRQLLAVRNAMGVLSLERSLHLDLELRAQPLAGGAHASSRSSPPTTTSSPTPW